METGRFGVVTDLRDRARPAQPRRARVRAAAPGRRDRVPHPLRRAALGRPGHERGGDRGRAAGRRLDVRARRRPARARDRAWRAIRTTSPPRCSAASCCARTAARSASTCPAGLEAVLVVPHEPVRTARRARGAARARCRWPTPSSTSPTPGCSCSAWRAATGTSSRAGSHDRLHQPHRAHLYPRSMALVRRARGARRARRDDLRRRARPCSCGARTRRRARCVARLAASARAGPRSAAWRSSRAAPTSCALAD